MSIGFGSSALALPAMPNSSPAEARANIAADIVKAQRQEFAFFMCSPMVDHLLSIVRSRDPSLLLESDLELVAISLAVCLARPSTSASWSLAEPGTPLICCARAKLVVRGNATIHFAVRMVCQVLCSIIVLPRLYKPW